MNKVSIILPFYNAESYLSCAIKSVINQSYNNWELILINDGSTDNSKVIVNNFIDSRIKYFEQENLGVSSARNLGLKKFSGDFILFLDADDALTINSLERRIELFNKNSDISFVDGFIEVFDENMRYRFRVWRPKIKELSPLQDLVRQTGKCFFNPSWLIKVDSKKTYTFDENLTHCEDLLFLINLSKENKKYSFISEPILKYRVNQNSAMKNLNGLEKGYRYVEDQLWDFEFCSLIDKTIYSFRWRKAMFLSYLRNLELIDMINLFKR